MSDNNTASETKQEEEQETEQETGEEAEQETEEETKQEDEKKDGEETEEEAEQETGNKKNKTKHFIIFGFMWAILFVAFVLVIVFLVYGTKEKFDKRTVVESLEDLQTGYNEQLSENNNNNIIPYKQSQDEGRPEYPEYPEYV